jgi:choline dehydrogenase-like flavoprotein
MNIMLLPHLLYIIISGGTADLTAASQLSEDASEPFLVVEAGTEIHTSPFITDATQLTAFVRNDIDNMLEICPRRYIVFYMRSTHRSHVSDVWLHWARKFHLV